MQTYLGLVGQGPTSSYVSYIMVVRHMGRSWHLLSLSKKVGTGRDCSMFIYIQILINGLGFNDSIFKTAQ